MFSPLRRRLFLAISVLTLAAGCVGTSNLSIFPGVHRIDLQQGNIIDQEKLDQLEIGMTKAQAQFVMGTPLISDTFDLDRWDYIFRLLSATGSTTQRSISLYFEDNLLVHIDRYDTSENDQESIEPENTESAETENTVANSE